MDPEIINEENLEQSLSKLLKGRSNPESDFGVVSMCCGSGRTPDKQHWPIKEYVSADGTPLFFRYKDTVVTYDTKKNILEFVTYGPGTGLNAGPGDAALGINPSIEEIMEQQKELYKELSKVRKNLHVNNPEINILPAATIIGFSRGGAAIQKMSETLVHPLPFPHADEDFDILGERIELDKTNGNYKVYNNENNAVLEGAISEEDKKLYNIDLEGDDSLLNKNINRCLWAKGEAGVGEDVLVDTDRTLWISLDAVAGRADTPELDDHAFNSEYCRGLYIMSTRLATAHAIVGFGATNPKGDGMTQLAINGVHGAVFDNEFLRETIIGSIGHDVPIKEKIEGLEEKITLKNQALLNKSILGKSVDSEADFRAEIIKDPQKYLQAIHEKTNEINSFWTKIGRTLHIGSGEERIAKRNKEFLAKNERIEAILAEENELRRIDNLHSIELQKETNDTISKIGGKLRSYFEGKVVCKTDLEKRKKEIAENLYDKFADLKYELEEESLTCDEIMGELQKIQTYVETAIDRHKDECVKASNFFQSKEGALGLILDNLMTQTTILCEKYKENLEAISPGSKSTKSESSDEDREEFTNSPKI